MKVKATQRGFFGSLRQAGDVFQVPDGSKASWFKPVETPADQPAEKPAEKPAKKAASKPAEKPASDEPDVI